MLVMMIHLRIYISPQLQYESTVFLTKIRMEKGYTPNVNNLRMEIFGKFFKKAICSSTSNGNLEGPSPNTYYFFSSSLFDQA